MNTTVSLGDLLVLAGVLVTFGMQYNEFRSLVNWAKKHRDVDHPGLEARMQRDIGAVDEKVVLLDRRVSIVEAKIH